MKNGYRRIRAIRGMVAGGVGLCLVLLLSAGAWAETTTVDRIAQADQAEVTELEAETVEGVEVTGNGRVVVSDPDELETVEMHVGRSRTITAPWQVSRVAVTAPEVADVQMLTPRQVLLQGHQAGETDVQIWSEDEQEVWQATVVVEADLRRLERQMAELFPGSDLQLRQSNGVVTVSGEFARAEHASQLGRLLEATGIEHVDMTRVSGVQQVMLQVRMAEASRTAFRRLGVDFLQSGSDFFSASQIGGGIDPEFDLGGADLPFSFVDSVNVSPGVTLFGGIPDADFQFFLQALAENQYMRILAEPNLIALSGEEASFLAGGEVPVTVSQGGAVAGAVTVEFKEFGVRLRFRPEVLGDGAIRLRVAPEVSEVVDVEPLPSGGLAPSLVTRRAETTVQLNSGQTFALAGLLNQTTNADVSRLPWLGNVPILGTLFRSTRYQRDETELVVLVTARLIEPVSDPEDRPTPGALHVPPTDWELYIEGELESKKLPQLGPADAEEFRERGLHRLRGPGAWTNHQEMSLRSYERAGARSRREGSERE